ncbi:MAG TPA: hypothetical protein VG367_02415 [Mucilaginibacter sp.]|nr:hypothetical protein [Mucilaginibacter sp.]
MGRLTILFAAIISLPFWVRGQVTDCPQWPAPCPHSEEINEAMDFASRTGDNKVTAQEMAMEANLRNVLTDILQKFTRLNHWELYEIMESNFDRPNSFISFAKWLATPYEKRPPHQYSISFVIVVNKDSLAAWQDWYRNVLPQQANQVVAAITTDSQNAQGNAVNQAYADSIQYYAQLSAKYMQDHAPEYVSDVQKNNQKGIKRYNDKVAWYQKKADEFSKKIQAPSTGSSSSASFNSFDAEKINKTGMYTNASIVLINFSANARLAGFGLNDGDQRSITPQRKLDVSDVFYAGLLHNPNKPDGQSYYMGEHDYLFDHPSDIATVLLGKWQLKRDSYNNVSAAYISDKTANDLVTIKPMKCDMVQNLDITIEGRPDHIKNILSQMDMEALRKLINQ